MKLIELDVTATAIRVPNTVAGKADDQAQNQREFIHTAYLGGENGGGVASEEGVDGR